MDRGAKHRKDTIDLIRLTDKPVQGLGIFILVTTQKIVKKLTVVNLGTN